MEEAPATGEQGDGPGRRAEERAQSPSAHLLREDDAARRD